MKSGINSREGLDVPICKTALFSGINAINRRLVTVTQCVSRDVRNGFFYFGSVFREETRNRFGMRLVQFGHICYLLFHVIAEQLMYSKYDSDSG